MDYTIKTPEQLGRVLRGFRAERRLTQALLGQKTGLAQNAISDFERDASRASVRRLFRILSGLGLELAVRDPQASPASRSRPPRRSSPQW
jgi:HTH-type transcriptional regulator/antitoxin HipB